MTAIMGVAGMREVDPGAVVRRGLGAMGRRGGRFRTLCIGSASGLGTGSRRDRRAGLLQAGDLGLRLACDGEILMPGAGAADLRAVAEAYRRDGCDLFSRLDGSFALVVWDERSGEMILVRDHAGTRPLHHAELDGGVIFASEIAGIRAGRGPVGGEVDIGAVDVFLSLSYVPAPGTMFSGIHQVAPGHLLRIGPGGVTEIPHLKQPVGPMSFADPPARSEQLRELLSAAIAERIETNPDAGYLLSGGVDSAAVLGTATSLRGRGLRTFTLGFPENPELDERAAARQVADVFGSEHRELPVDSTCLRFLAGITRHTQSPVGNAAALISREMFGGLSSTVDAVFGGDGGNEIFGGTYKYLQVMNHIGGGGLRARAAKALGRRAWRMVEDTRLEPVFQKMARSYFGRIGKGVSSADKTLSREEFIDASRYYAALNCVWSAAGKQRLYCRSVRDSLVGADPLAGVAGMFDPGSGIHFLQQMHRSRTLSFIPFDAMLYLEYVAAGAGVTPLFPLLDRRLTEFMYAVPYRYLFALGFRHFMRESLAGKILPDHLFARPYKGFKPPLESWLRRDDWRRTADDLIGEEAVRARGIFESGFIADIRSRFESGQKYLVFGGDGQVQTLADSIWSLMALETWFRENVDSGIPSADDSVDVVELSPSADLSGTER